MSLPSMTDDVGRVLGGRYRIVAPIGAGASARVYLADDVTLRRRVAVKVLHEGLAGDDNFLRRFRAEAQSAASLNHPHVLGVYDWGHDDLPYLVSEYLGGGSLGAMFDAGHRLSPSQTLLVGLEAARGLEYAHGEGLVHRDIKPANLLFGENGRLRIADFGLARALAEAGWTDPDGSMVGTARYAAPEQARGERVGPPADVYALALSINECVSGEVPFVKDTAVATLMARAEAVVEPHPDLGPLAGAIRRATALDPAQRSTAEQLAAELMGAAGELPRPEPLPLAGALADGTVILDGDDATVHVATPAPAPAPVSVGGDHLVDEPDDEPRSRKGWLIAALVMVLLAVGGGVGAWFLTQPVTHEVPDLVGASLDDARAVAEENSWELEQIEVREPDSVAGEIVRTTPAAGESLEEEGVLEVALSLGEPLVTIPEVAGMTVPEAEAALIAADLALGSTTPVASEDIPADIVIQPDMGLGETEVEPGTEVDLLVSSGPEDRIVPEVPESRDQAEAEALLSELRLVPVISSEFSSDVDEGEVIRFDPETGASAPAESEVTIVISDGPEPVPVPNVVGDSVEVATQKIEDAGLRVSRVEGSPSDPVIASDPPAGTVVDQGTGVVIATSL